MTEDTDQLTITDFLLARIAEDEYEANVCLEQYRRGEGSSRRWTRMLAECAAKRRIIELHRSWPVLVETPPELDTVLNPDDVDSLSLQMSQRILWTTEQKYRERFGAEPPTGPIIHALASVYADDPDYRDEWR